MSNHSTPTRLERPSRPSPALALDASLYANKSRGTYNTAGGGRSSNPTSPYPSSHFSTAHLSTDGLLGGHALSAEPSSAREGRNAPPSTPLPTGMSRSTSATEPRGLHAAGGAPRFHQSHSFNSSPIGGVHGGGAFLGDSSPESSPLSSPAGPRSMLSPGVITRAGAAEEASKIRLPTVAATQGGGVVSPPRNGNANGGNGGVAPRTLSYAVSGVDEYPEEDDDEEDDRAVGGLPLKPSSNSQLASRFENQTHPEPPFHVKDVSRSANNKSKDNFPPFSPSELRPYSSPSPSSKLAYRSASHLEAQHAENEFLNVPAAATQSGFSPKHANWDQSHPYDESYEVEGSDDGKTPSASPKQSPLRRPASFSNSTGSPPPLRMNSQRQSQQQMMSPTTRSAVDSIVPALSWLLILNRKLQLSGAITALQSKHLKSQVLAGNPALLSAVDRFVKGKNQDAIIQALMSCLPEDEIDNSVDAAREAAREEEDENEDDEDEDEEEEGEDDEDDEDDEFEADYKAIMHGRGQGGHKPTPTRARTTPGTDAANLISSPRLDFGTAPARNRDEEDEQEESDDEEEENPLLIANTLVPLSLPQLESLGSLLRSLGFSMLDMETLSLCTSALLTPVDRNNASGAGVTVSSAQWNECIKSLRLHSHNPKLFTHLLQSLFRILDLQQTDSVPYGELVSSIAVFCRGKPKQKLQFIFQALRHSGGIGGSANTPSSTSSAFSHNSSPSSPTDPSVSYLPCTIIYGFLFSFSLTLHVLLALALSPSNASLEQRLDSITQTINVQNKAVWSLTNGFYALFDRQFETANSSSEDQDQDATISYKQFVQWHHSPVFIIDTLLERSGQ